MVERLKAIEERVRQINELLVSPEIVFIMLSSPHKAVTPPAIKYVICEFNFEFLFLFIKNVAPKTRTASTIIKIMLPTFERGAPEFEHPINFLLCFSVPIRII